MPKEAYEYMKLPVYLSMKWIVVRNYYAFITIIENKGVPDIISFDHDLADVHYKQQTFDYDAPDYEKTGYHCAQWLIYHCIDNNKELPTEVIVHSMNPTGSLNIKSLFESFYKVYKKDYPPIILLPSFRRTS